MPVYLGFGSMTGRHPPGGDGWQHAAAAAALGERIRSEDGIGVALHLIERS